MQLNEHYRLQALMDFTSSQYGLISNGSVSQAMALSNIIETAETLNQGNQRQAIRDLTRVVVGDDIYRNGTGDYHVPFVGKPYLKGGTGFAPQYADDSIQIVHATVGLYLASEWGDLGTMSGDIREAWTNITRGRAEWNDYNLFHITNFVVETASHSKS